MGAEKMHEPLITPFFPTSSFLDLMTEQVRSPRPMGGCDDEGIGRQCETISLRSAAGSQDLIFHFLWVHYTMLSISHFLMRHF